MFTLLAVTGVLLMGCLDTTEEATINADGSGNFSTTNDLSAVMGLAKQMGGADAEMEQVKIDTTISLATIIDSVPGLTADEKNLMQKGEMKMKVNLEAEVVVFSMHFPFGSTAQIPELSKLATKLMNETLKKQMGGEEGGPMGDMPEPSSVDSYFEMSYKNGQIKRKLNKDKYAGVGSDEYLNGMKQATQMGIPVTTTQVFNLPRPAKSVEGKAVVLSDDRKKVTIKTSLDAFLEDAKELEYEIEY